MIELEIGRLILSDYNDDDFEEYYRLKMLNMSTMSGTTAK